ncbi:N-acetylmuramic acid 6-phosphate etherase [Prochlorococcus marinus]|uniref:N-acetylmuramic acid 6-phosphate etherase n=1 Tax=Prochlorococcus marinus (strain MIT 9211) TaxID=93059 RepID=A9BAD8_PROM4|nr:N-acetylmuramic acid 6-phosphate etherase [Prochlorococcus marinus]ABX08800.1 Predicted sugar phosphate isomerase [Prochlorococcus marinus str. MIT 9211]
MDNKTRGYLLTEQINSNSKNLDILSTYEMVQLFVEEDLLPQLAVSNSLNDLVDAIDKIYIRLRKGGRLFYLGAGSSGRLGVLDASECPPTFCTPPELVQGIIAGGSPSLTKSSEGLEDRTDLSIIDLKNRGFDSNDCLVGITAGGTTPYVISGLEYAKTLNALTICISSVPKDQVNINTDIDIRLLTGPELLSGSTRLKAGTATKMALNIISTGVMVRLGKVYGNRMIDLSIANSKLLDRSIRILTDLTNLSREEANELLNLSEGSVKLALLIALSGLDLNSSKKLLKENHDNLRIALEKIKL